MGIQKQSDDIAVGQEIWKDIPGYPGYQASSLGRIRSLDREIIRSDGRRRWLKGRNLVGKLTRTRRYYAVNPGMNRPPVEVHRLVALAFIGPCPEGYEVMHLNGNKLDNRPDNLQYGTHLENMHDIYRQGGKLSKLTEEDVHQIRFGLCCGYTLKELAEMYHLHPCNIGRIRNGVAYSYL